MGARVAARARRLRRRDSGPALRDGARCRAPVAWLNPAAVTLLLARGAAGLPWEIGRSFLVPAAPNLAHVVFFASLLLARRDGSHEGN